MRTLVILVLFSAIGCTVQVSDDDKEEDDFDENDEDIEEESFLVEQDELHQQRIELLPGDTKNSQWLLVDNQYICHLKIKSKENSEFFWECKEFLLLLLQVTST